MNKIKILHVSFAGGGVDIAIRIINEHIDASKFETLVIREEPHELYLDKNGKRIPSFILPVKREVAFSDFINGIKLYKLIQNLKPDILHLHSTKAGIYGRIIGLAYTGEIFFSPHAFSFLSARNSLKRKIYIGIEKLVKILSPKTTIVACSKSEYNRAIQQIGYSKSKVKIYRNSIPHIERKNLIQPKNIVLPSTYLCTIGRPSYQKNLDFMIDILYALHKKNQIQNLVIMGIGYYSPEFKKIKDKIKKLELDNFITLLPWMNRDHALGILENSNIYVSTARYEGLPLSIIEAMCLGIPAVASQVDGNRDLIVNNKTGFLVNEFNLTQFVDKINLILTNKSIKKRLSKGSADQFTENYDTNTNIKILEKIYSDGLV